MFAYYSTRIDDDGCNYSGNSQHRCVPKVNYRHKEKEVLDQILGPGSYDARIRPSGVNGTGKIRLNIMLFLYKNEKLLHAHVQNNPLCSFIFYFIFYVYFIKLTLLKLCGNDFILYNLMISTIFVKH